MRSSVIAAALSMTAVPVFAQSPLEVTRTLKPAMVMCTDVPAAVKPIPKLVLRGPHTTDQRTAVTSGSMVITRTPEDGLAVGQRYITQRLHGDPKQFPRPGEGYGDLRITGIVTVTALDDLNALVSVDFACDSVENGDFLEPYAETVLPATVSAPVVPDFSDRASVLFGVDNRVLFGDGDVLSINRGTLHGVVPGARYAIYRDRRDGLPLVHLGEAVVLTTGEQTSKVLITQATDAVEAGDVMVPRRTP